MGTFYLIQAMRSELPWNTCKHDYAHINCTEDLASKEYYDRIVLKLSPGKSPSWYHYGKPNIELVGCLFLTLLIICLSLLSSIVKSGRIVYFTATFPYIVLISLFVRGITLPGAWIGIERFLHPDLTILREPEPWLDAAGQVVFTLSLGIGSNIVFASYNKFNNNFARDAFQICTVNLLTSLTAGVSVFAVLGSLAHSRGYKTDKQFDEIASEGVEFTFIIFPTALSQMPGSPPFWSVLFFLMVVSLGLGTMLGMLETVIDATTENFKTFKNRQITSIFVCALVFLCGLPMCSPSGPLLINLLDNVIGNWACLLSCAAEVFLMSWIYRLRRAMEDSALMGVKVSVCLRSYLLLSLKIVAPIIILVVGVWSYTSISRKIHDEDEPLGITIFRWFLLAAVNLWLPLGAMIWSCKFIVAGQMPIWTNMINVTRKWDPIRIPRPHKMLLLPFLHKEKISKGGA